MLELEDGSYLPYSFLTWETKEEAEKYVSSISEESKKVISVIVNKMGDILNCLETLDETRMNINMFKMTFSSFISEWINNGCNIPAGLTKVKYFFELYIGYVDSKCIELSPSVKYMVKKFNGICF